MRPLAVLLMVGLAACRSSRATPAPEPRQRATVVVGFVDGGWPGPSGRGEPGIRFAVARAADRFCEQPLDSAVADSAGWFRLTAPPRPDSAGARWQLCRTPGSAPERPRLPTFRYRGRGADSLRLYCRLHGPAGSPECRYVPWGVPMRWPGGEDYDSVPVPPHNALQTGGRAAVRGGFAAALFTAPAA